MMESPDGAPPEPSPTARSRYHWIWENLLSLAVALIIVFIVRSSLIEPFKIPSGSMIPTLLIGDHIFVNKLAYNVNLPLSELFNHRPTTLIRRAPPRRGEVIVFIYPKDESLFYIKRVVGVAGDTIEIRNRALLLNGKPVPREPAAAADIERVFKSLDDPRYAPSNLDLLVEDLAGIKHPILLDKNNFMNENHGPVTVPPDALFVMGDNRDFSNDSRFWGFVPIQNVKGRAMVIWLSMWLSFADRQFTFRPERIGTVLR